MVSLSALLGEECLGYLRQHYGEKRVMLFS